MPARAAVVLLLLASLGCDDTPTPVEEEPGFRPDFRTGHWGCDEIITRYRACIGGHTPASVREVMLANFEATFVEWQVTHQRERERGAGHGPLSETCAEALEEWRRTVAVLGCEPVADQPE